MQRRLSSGEGDSLHTARREPIEDLLGISANVSGKSQTPVREMTPKNATARRTGPGAFAVWFIDRKLHAAGATSEPAGIIFDLMREERGRRHAHQRLEVGAEVRLVEVARVRRDLAPVSAVLREPQRALQP